MSIIKIKNLKYSQSKQQTEAKWAGLQAKRYKLLAESDWTQLPDVQLTEFTKNRWANWRMRVRYLARENFDTIDEYERELKAIEYDRTSLYVEYAELGLHRDADSSRKFLRQLLTSMYTSRVSHTFIPNLEEKYQETLDILSILYPTELNDMTSTQLIARLESMDEIDIDVRHYPFVEVTLHSKGFLTLNETLVFILKQREERYNFALQEEYTLIHFGNIIDSCSKPEDFARAKIEIEMNYGH